MFQVLGQTLSPGSGLSGSYGQQPPGLVSFLGVLVVGVWSRAVQHPLLLLKTLPSHEGTLPLPAVLHPTSGLLPLKLDRSDPVFLLSWEAAGDTCCKMFSHKTCTTTWMVLVSVLQHSSCEGPLAAPGLYPRYKQSLLLLLSGPPWHLLLRFATQCSLSGQRGSSGESLPCLLHFFTGKITLKLYTPKKLSLSSGVG